MKEYDLKAEFEVDDPDSFTISLMRENAQKSTSKSSPKIIDLSKEELKSKKTTKTRLLEALLETGEKLGRNKSVN